MRSYTVAYCVLRERLSRISKEPEGYFTKSKRGQFFYFEVSKNEEEGAVVSEVICLGIKLTSVLQSSDSVLSFQ